MIVLLLSLLFASIPAKCQNNGTQLKSQLRKSLSHVHALLADIEGKIESEKKLLSQINYNLNYNEPPGFLDYEVTDIWWAKTSPVSSPSQQANAGKHKGRAYEPSTFKHPLRTNPTTRSIITLIKLNVSVTDSGLQHTTTKAKEPFPLPPNFTFPGAPEGWVPFQDETTTIRPFLKELKNIMAEHQIGYFSVFVSKYAEWIGNKPQPEVIPIINASIHVIDQTVQSGKIDIMGETLVESVKAGLIVANLWTQTMIQQHAAVVVVLMTQRRRNLPEQFNKAVDFYETLITPEEGDKLIETLESLVNYPEGGKSPVEVVQAMIDATLLTVERIKGTRNHRKLVSLINTAIRYLFPDYRAMDKPSKPVFDRNLSNVSKAENMLLSNISALPSRRGMEHNIKKMMRHFLVKHPKLFKSFNRHYKRSKRKNRHHRGRKRHHRGSHKKHKKNRNRKNKRKRTHARGVRVHVKKAKGIKKRTYRKNNDKFEDSSASGAFYRAPVIRNKNIFKKPAFTIPPPTFPNNIHAEYFKHLTKRLIAKKKRQNFRRFMNEKNESIEESSQTHSEHLQNLTDVTNIHKIREISSYSDEEDSLRTNLYDALRHGNRSFPQFRADNDDNNEPLKDISSETDDEWVIKNNIYKVFEQS